MSLMLPPGMMPPQGGPPPQDAPVTMYTQAAIQACHDAIAHEPNPQHKLLLSRALQIILQVQQDATQQRMAG